SQAPLGNAQPTKLRFATPTKPGDPSPAQSVPTGARPAPKHHAGKGLERSASGDTCPRGSVPTGAPGTAGYCTETAPCRGDARAGLAGARQSMWGGEAELRGQCVPTLPTSFKGDASPYASAREPH